MNWADRLAKLAQALSTGGVVPDASIDAAIARDSEVTSAVSTHAAASDPHADRSFATSAVGTHEADTTSIHGIANTANLYAVGGTDVAVADGGTGAGTAAGARTNLGLGTAATAATGDFEAAGVVATHAGAADPHTVYQLESGLAAAITATKIDDLTAGDDNTDLNATTGVHGLLPKLGGGSTNFLRADGTWNAPGGSGGAPTDAQYLVGAAHGDLSAEIVVTAAGLALLDDAAASNQRTTLGLAIGTDVAAYVPSSGFGTPLTGALAETYGRNSGSGNNATLVTGRLQMVAIQLPKGLTVTTISFVSATTALSVGVNQWFALFDINRNLLRVTNDHTSTAWPANSVKTLTCTTPYEVPTSGLYYLGCMVLATTVPTLLGIGALGVIAGLAPILHGDSTAALTNPASCPNPAGALANATTTKLCYAFVS